MDMHVHSRASDKPVTAALSRLRCPESFSEPEEVYARARAAGMDLVTLTDHDTIRGGLELIERGFEGVILGEEVTVFFPEDRCKLHVLVWGLTPELHEEIESLDLREDVYAFAHWLRENILAHALAHPLYVQNGRLSLWHLERCALMFKGFETLNGAHAGTHREALERWLDTLSPARILDLIDRHAREPLWPRIWEKHRTAGSDDHALLNVGKTWTGVPIAEGETLSPPEFLKRVVAGKAKVGGQAGHSALLAHQLMTVGFNYYAHRWHDKLGPIGRDVGSRVVRFSGIEADKPSKLSLIKEKVSSKLDPTRGDIPLIARALRECVGPLLEQFPDIRSSLEDPNTQGPAMANHEQMADFADDLSEALATAMQSDTFKALKSFDKSGMCEAVISYASVLALQAPHIFSLFHQNKERQFVDQIQRQTDELSGKAPRDPNDIRVMLFTDTLGDINGVCRFIQNMGDQAAAAGRNLQIVTSTRMELPERDHITNFKPIFASSMPKYENLEAVLPPVTRMLRFADQFQPDAIHVSTPGGVGLVGLLAARMLRVPVVGVYHTDFPAYIDHLFGDEIYTSLTSCYMKMFYKRFSSIFSRSADYIESLTEFGIDANRLVRLIPGVALESFRPDYEDKESWSDYAISSTSVKVLYCGRVSVEKNLPLLTAVWPDVRKACGNAGFEADLIVVGDGPYREEMQRTLGSVGAHFLGFRHGDELSRLYASSDLFVFPSETDTLGQVVLESQASGLPVIVTDKGGPQEVVDDGISGVVLPGGDTRAWKEAIIAFVTDPDRRQRMGRSAQTRSVRYSLKACFDHFWEIHARAVQDEDQPRAASVTAPRPKPSPVGH